MAEDVEMTPISPDEGGSVPPKLTPFGAASAAPAPTPMPAPTPASAASAASAAPAAPAAGPATIKLKPVIRKPMIHKPTIGGAKPVAMPTPAAAPAAAKKATQNLKSVTGPIPAQATLKKTGIIAEGIITQQQQQAAKSKTSRISLESAIGVSQAKDNGPAPLKTIRLRRPTDLKPAGGAAPLVPPAAAAAASKPVGADDVPELPADDAATTQKKTLKLQRPGGIGIKRPSMNIGTQPGVGGGDVPDMGGGEVSSLKPIDIGDVSDSDSTETPGWLMAISLVASIAALLAVGLLVYNFMGEKPLDTDANEMVVSGF